MVAGGLTLTGCGGGGSSSGSTTAGSTADVVVHGNDALRFDQKEYAAKAGTVTIELVDDGSTPHTLLIEKVSGFSKLAVNSKGSKARGSATLEPGTYTIYCDVAGHRGAGMEAKIVVN
jgi:plastocyanin